VPILGNERGTYSEERFRTRMAFFILAVIRSHRKKSLGKTFLGQNTLIAVMSLFSERKRKRMNYLRKKKEKKGKDNKKNQCE